MIPHIKGIVTRQAHVNIPADTVEEEYARNGFSGGYAHLYRSQAPVGWTRIEGPLRPRAFDLRMNVPPGHADYLQSRRDYLYNDDVKISFARVLEAMPFTFRNADADEVLFVHAGAGDLESDFGFTAYRQGDYLVIPRGTAYRLSPQLPTELLIVQCYSEVRFPEKGMLGQHALFDPAVVHVPEPGPRKPADGREHELRVLHRGEITRVFYPFDPLNTVGWKGTLSVLQLNVNDIRPVMSDRYHLPPSAHTTFVAHNAVICSFLPRPLENGDPGALKVPFFHSNIDFDEVIFYHHGNFFSRAGIRPGMITYHPQGIHHGPQPKAVERSGGAKFTDEVAVMIDTRRPLDACPGASDSEWRDYWMSWSQ